MNLTQKQYSLTGVSPENQMKPNAYHFMILITKAMVLGALVTAALPPAYSQTILLHDTFADGQRDNQNLPNSAAWYLLNDTAVTPTLSVNTESELAWADKATTYSAVMAYFTPVGQPQSLGIGDSLKIEFRMAPDNLPGNIARALRIGVMNSGGKRVTADALHNGSTGQAVGTTFTDWRGYALYTAIDAYPWADLLQVFERSSANASLFSSGAYTQVGALGASGTFAELQFSPFEVTITRRADQMEITGKAADATIGPVIDTTALVTAFDTLALFTGPQVNGLRLDDVKVTYIPNPSPSDDPNLVVLTDIVFGKQPLDAPLPIIGRVSLKNSGASKSLAIGSQSEITGPDAAVYSIVTLLPLSIAPGATGVVEVAFNPQARSGDFVAALQLHSNDPSEPVLATTLDARYFHSGDELLTNPGFEMPDTLMDWAQSGSLLEVPGLITGSTKAVFLSSDALLGRTNMVVPSTFQIEFRLAVQDTPGLAFLLWLKTYPGFDSLNPFFYLRYQAGQFNVMTNINDGLWSDDLGLGSLEASMDVTGNGGLSDPEDIRNVYRLRLIAYNWGGDSPTYDMALSEKNSDVLSRQVTGLSGFAGGGGGGAAPPVILIFVGQGTPGYWIDEVRLIAGRPPGLDFSITRIARDSASGNVNLTWQSEVGVAYGVESTTTLGSAWASAGPDVTATGTSATFTHANSAGATRFYRVVRR